jgi:hypothetical protein
MVSHKIDEKHRRAIQTLLEKHGPDIPELNVPALGILGIGQASVSHAARNGKKSTDQKKMTWTVQ